ncbi:fre family ferric-chelate reductase [Diplodia corticola]|uniref:Fre family ferric-chelate reductase n=1 Tax=Diplodia corticola TaxID=236234 RepID=A0A1J9QNL4_9PEZI|nr:fre family ferric-chelate reductase [Diplodia corticola]OJD29650.1 fre family ferric-chelate reductase [Diplodia corticola]
MADPERNSTEQVSEPVLLSRAYFERSYESYRLKLESSPRSRRFGWALDCYWGGIVLLGILKACFGTFADRRTSATRGDIEHSGSVTTKSRKPLAPFVEVCFWLKTHIFVPATIGTRCQRRLLECTIPKRSVSMPIMAFWCLCIVLGVVGYPTIANNTLTPNIHQYIWNAVAVRCGYMAYSLLPWVWMFAQRNNIFIWATGWSYATFSAFHRHCARAATIFSIVHGISYSVVYAQYKLTYQTSLAKNWFRFGIVSVILMSLLVASSAGYLRVRYYDSFLVVHICFCIVLLYSLFFHTSKFTDGEYNVYLWPLVAIWSFDRLLRIARIFYCNFRVNFREDGAVSPVHSATVRYDTSSDVIRIDMQPGPWLKPAPGQYYHLYQPFVPFGWWENHPFSLAAYQQPPPSPVEQAGTTPSSAAAASSTSSSSSSTTTHSSPNATTTFTFWIRPHTGWTRRLRNQCLASPSPSNNTISPRPLLLLEGPYGHPHPPLLRLLHSYSSSSSAATPTTITFLVGGTGIAAAAPYILAFASSRSASIKLVWAARHAAFLRDVCRNELAGALRLGQSGDQGAKNVEAVLFATGAGAEEEEEEEEEEEDAAGEVAVRRGRPDVGRVVAEAAEAAAAEGDGRAVVFVCGPAGMADEAREAVRGEMRRGCRRIEYVEECFGW